MKPRLPPETPLRLLKCPWDLQVPSETFNWTFLRPLEPPENPLWSPNKLWNSLERTWDLQVHHKVPLDTLKCPWHLLKTPWNAHETYSSALEIPWNHHTTLPRPSGTHLKLKKRYCDPLNPSETPLRPWDCHGTPWNLLEHPETPLQFFETTHRLQKTPWSASETAWSHSILLELLKRPWDPLESTPKPLEYPETLLRPPEIHLRLLECLWDPLKRPRARWNCLW